MFCLPDLRSIHRDRWHQIGSETTDKVSQGDGVVSVISVVGVVGIVSVDDVVIVTF